MVCRFRGDAKVTISRCETIACFYEEPRRIEMPRSDLNSQTMPTSCPRALDVAWPFARASALKTSSPYDISEVHSVFVS